MIIQIIYISVILCLSRSRRKSDRGSKTKTRWETKDEMEVEILFPVLHTHLVVIE